MSCEFVQGEGNEVNRCYKVCSSGKEEIKQNNVEYKHCPKFEYDHTKPLPRGGGKSRKTSKSRKTKQNKRKKRSTRRRR